MKWYTLRDAMSGSQLFRRLFSLFVVAALIPLGVSAWLSTAAIDDVADSLNLRDRTQSTKQMGRQVFDRLKAGRAVLVTAIESPGARSQIGADLPSGLGGVFVRFVPAAAAGVPAGELETAWRQARPPNTKHPFGSRSSSIEVSVRILAGEPPARVLMGVSRDGQLLGVAEFRNGYLWAPLEDARPDTLWSVYDSEGRALVNVRGVGVVEARPFSGDETSPLAEYRDVLYLGAEFGAPDWTFVQTAPQPRVLWQGWSLAVWLGLVASATLLVVTLVARCQIRRILRPLHSLTEATHRLATGSRHARVDITTRDELGQLAGAFNVMADQLEEQFEALRDRAVHDGLTHLLNREGLHAALRSLLGVDGAAALLLIDLDHFKDVNDTRGHHAGDELLRLAAARLREGVPSSAIVARQGGDEFAVLLPGADVARAQEVAQNVVERMRQPFDVSGGQHVLGASIGLAQHPQHGRTPDELMRCADVALYAAKARGRGRHQVYDEGLDTAASERVLLLAALRQAQARLEWVLHYQPRVDARTGRVGSAEALVRWQRPGHGLVYPGAFIAAAESSGLIEELGGWVLDQACAQMVAWRRDGLPIECVSVNVSTRQLESGRLPDVVRDTLAHHALPASALELEVTESLLLGDVENAREQLERIRGRGVRIAIDDFGTGYSSMSILHRLPIDVMKIDQSFVAEMTRAVGARAVVRAIIAMAQAMNLHLVAEGVETEEQALLLRSLGCDELQGYLYGRPVPVDEFVRALEVKTA
jgi:diguanylate cyclase (GGDEF)-like protein